MSVITARTKNVIFHAFFYFCFFSGCVGAGIFIVATSYVTQRYLCVLFLVLGVGFSGVNATGYAVNHLDIAPRYAGLLMGLSNTFGSMPGFLSPMLTGYIAHSKVLHQFHRLIILLSVLP